jgi:hypothetical protein
MQNIPRICGVWRARESALQFSPSPSNAEISNWVLTIFGLPLDNSPLRNSLNQLDLYVLGKRHLPPIRILKMPDGPSFKREEREAEDRADELREKFDPIGRALKIDERIGSRL